jgi:superfamily I DNA/RNA helicase
LEFDHVILVGLNAEVTIHGQEDDDDSLLTLRRLLAMGIGRARESVILGYKPSEASRLVDYLDPKTYSAVDL